MTRACTRMFVAQDLIFWKWYIFFGALVGVNDDEPNWMLIFSGIEEYQELNLQNIELKGTDPYPNWEITEACWNLSWNCGIIWEEGHEQPNPRATPVERWWDVNPCPRQDPMNERPVRYDSNPLCLFPNNDKSERLRVFSTSDHVNQWRVIRASSASSMVLSGCNAVQWSGNY